MMSNAHFSASNVRVGDGSSFRQGDDYHGPVTIIKNDSNQSGSPQPGTRTAFHDAVSEGNKAKIEELLQAGADINAHDPEGYTPLNIAIWKGNDAVAQLLLDQKPELNNVGATLPPLHAAVLNGNRHVAELLLDRGADVDRRTRSGGDTPLLVAAAKGEGSLVELFLERGANANARNTHGRTALFGAVRSKNADMVKMLLQKGVAPSQGDISGSILIFIGRDHDVSQAFENHGDAQTKQKIRAKRDADVLNKIRRGGYDILNSEEDRGRALVFYTGLGYEPEIRFLLEKGADPSYKGREGTPLIKAVERGYSKLVRLLVEAGADLAATYGPRETIVHLAVKSDNTAFVELFLQRGADPNSKTSVGSTPLHYAAIFDSEPMTSLLLASGADPHTRDANGQRPMEIAKHRSPQVVALLQAAMAEGPKEPVSKTSEI